MGQIKQAHISYEAKTARDLLVAIVTFVTIGTFIAIVTFVAIGTFVTIGTFVALGNFVYFLKPFETILNHLKPFEM